MRRALGVVLGGPNRVLSHKLSFTRWWRSVREGWFNQDRLHGELHDATAAEVEAAYYRNHPHADAA